MSTSYAVTWQRGEQATRAGRLELLPGGLTLEGSGTNGAASETIDFGDLLDVRIGRATSDRLSGRQTLVLERRGGAPIRIASIVQPGVITELAEHLASRLREEDAMSRAVVVLPLREGASERAAQLLRSGPPFDPEEVGLDRHHVFLTDEEAVFVFESDDLEAAERLIGGEHLLESSRRLEGARRRASAHRRGRLFLGASAGLGAHLVRAHTRAGRQ